MKVYKSSLLSYFIFTVAFVAAIFLIIFWVVPAIDRAKPEYPYSPELKDGQNAILEIVDLDPSFETSSSKMICSCHLTNGSNVWLLMSHKEYDSFEGATTGKLGNTTTYADLTFSKPVTVHGRVRNSDKVGIKGLKGRIKDPIIIIFKSKD